MNKMEFSESMRVAIRTFSGLIVILNKMVLSGERKFHCIKSVVGGNEFCNKIVAGKIEEITNDHNDHIVIAQKRLIRFLCDNGEITVILERSLDEFWSKWETQEVIVSPRFSTGETFSQPEIDLHMFSIHF